MFVCEYRCACHTGYVQVSEHPQVWILASLLETGSLLFSCYGVPGCQALQLLGVTLSLPPIREPGLQRRKLHVHISHRFGDLNSGSHACTTSTVFTEPPSSPVLTGTLKRNMVQELRNICLNNQD